MRSFLVFPISNSTGGLTARLQNSPAHRLLPGPKPCPYSDAVSVAADAGLPPPLSIIAASPPPPDPLAGGGHPPHPWGTRTVSGPCRRPWPLPPMVSPLPPFGSILCLEPLEMSDCFLLTLNQTILQVNWSLVFGCILRCGFCSHPPWPVTTVH